MEAIFGYSWFDEIKEHLLTSTISSTKDKNNDSIKPRHRSAVSGYPSGFT